MNPVLLIVVGTAAGFIATRLMRIEAGLAVTVAIGIGGALIGTVLMRALMTVMGAASGFVGAILGTLVLLWIWKTYIAGR